MAATTYKCPNCGAFLSFDPETQGWKCDFCDTVLKEVEEKNNTEQAKPAEEGHQVMYRCQSCGSEIMTDETTVATHCYYCHSPVILEGKLTRELRPDSVVPFTVSKEKAVASFMQWVKGKFFVPSDFFKKSVVENMQGVYHPHFVTECQFKGILDGEARDVDTSYLGDYKITKTAHYHVRREADITLKDIMRPALSKTNRKLTDTIQPFPLEEAKPFDDAYLTGFLAERRDLEAESYRSDIAEETLRYVNPLMTSSVLYDEDSLVPSAEDHKLDTRCVLLPTWLLTYPNRKNKDDPYYYIVNGCTGAVSGKLPIDRKKLCITSVLLGAAVFAAACVLCYFVF